MKNLKAGVLLMASALLVALVVPSAGYATQGMDRREERRDDRREGRDDKRECKQGDDSRAECRQEKRDTKRGSDEPEPTPANAPPSQ